eukprot:COSAG02_NODE_4761_length_5016_cov_3.037014_3_plen_53_part_00
MPLPRNAYPSYLASYAAGPDRVEMVMVNLDGKYTCGTKNASATPLRTGWHAS